MTSPTSQTPLSTRNVVKLLKSEGYIVNYGYIRYLIRDAIINDPKTIMGGYAWFDNNLEELRNCLKNRGKKKS